MVSFSVMPCTLLSVLRLRYGAAYRETIAVSLSFVLPVKPRWLIAKPVFAKSALMVAFSSRGFVTLPTARKILNAPLLKMPFVPWWNRQVMGRTMKSSRTATYIQQVLLNEAEQKSGNEVKNVLLNAMSAAKANLYPWFSEPISTPCLLLASLR